MSIIESVVLERANEVIPLPEVGFREMLLSYSFRVLGWTNLDLAELIANLEEDLEVSISKSKFIDVEEEETLEDLVIYLELLKGY